MHPDRQRRTAELAQLADDEQWERLYQRLMLQEFPYEARMGWQLAFLRPFAVPRMADILVAAGQLVDRPRKRAYDTGLIIYEIVYGGLDSPRARKMVSLINRAHHGFSIEGEDMTYVLCAFIVTPLRHIDLLGWRRLTDAERESSVRFFGRLAELMNIQTIPRTYDEAAAIYDAYEASHIAPSPSARLLSDNLMRVLKDMQPRFAQPFATLTFTLLLNDVRIVKALGLHVPGRLTRRLARSAMHRFGFIKAQRKPSEKEIFTPGKVVPEMYPHGYELADLGPDVDRDHEEADRSRRLA